MTSNRTDVVKLPLPSGIKAGLLVGRGGHNSRWLHYNSGGAHITVNDAAISIRAKDCLVRARAIQLVRRQLDAMGRFAAHDNFVPIRVDYILLEPAFGSDPRVRFCSRNDALTAATGLKDRFYVLAPEPKQPTGGEEQPAGLCPFRRISDDTCLPADRCKVLDSRTANAASTSQRDQDEVRDQDQAFSSDGQPAEDPADGATRFHATSAWTKGLPSCGSPPLLASAGRALAAAVSKAACCEPSFDVLKVRFKLGKSLFRNLGPRAGKTGLSVADLEGAGAGRGAYQSVFSNFVPASAVPRLTSWLTGSLGFALVDTKTTATLHVINQELNVHYSIALTMDRGDDSTASLRKLKAGGSKNHTVTLMTAPDQMDLRLKLITQFKEHPGLAYDADAYTTARRVAAAVRTEGFDGFTRSKRGLPRNRHLEYARRKTKYVYEGVVPAGGEGGCGQRLRVSVTQVQDDKGTHYEVSGCLPEVDARLRSLVVAREQAAGTDSSGCYIPEWRRGRSSGGGCRRVHDSVSSSPARTRATTPDSDPDSRWAVSALAALSEFVAQLNDHLGPLLGGQQPAPAARMSL